MKRNNARARQSFTAARVDCFTLSHGGCDVLNALQGIVATRAFDPYQKTFIFRGDVAS